MAVPIPPKVIEPTVSLVIISAFAPVDITKEFEFAPSADVLFITKVPAETVVVPVLVLVPDNLQVPAPFLVNEVGVDITPDIVPVPAEPSNVKPKAPVPTVPLQVNVPELVAVIVLAEPKEILPL